MGAMEWQRSNCSLELALNRLLVTPRTRHPPLFVITTSCWRINLTCRSLLMTVAFNHSTQSTSCNADGVKKTKQKRFTAHSISLNIYSTFYILLLVQDGVTNMCMYVVHKLLDTLISFWINKISIYLSKLKVNKLGLDRIGLYTLFLLTRHNAVCLKSKICTVCKYVHMYCMYK